MMQEEINHYEGELSSKKGKGKLPVIELFGPTIQGEGFLAGRRSHFLRFGGCPYRCAWALAGSTKILTPDLRQIPLSSIKPGDHLVGFSNRRMCTTEVVAARRVPDKLTKIVTFEDGNYIIATDEHRFYRVYRHKGKSKRPNYVKCEDDYYRRVDTLRPGWLIRGFGASLKTIEPGRAWYEGYLSGAMRGDGHIGSGWIGLGATDEGFVHATASASAFCDTPLHRLSNTTTDKGTPLFKLRLPERFRPDFVNTVNKDMEPCSEEFKRGWLAGFFDAEGTIPTGPCYYTNKDRQLLEKCTDFAETLGFETRTDFPPALDGVGRVNILDNVTTFLAYIGIRSWSKAIKAHSRGMKQKEVAVSSVLHGPNVSLYDIQTTTGNFIANGMLVHNCDSMHAVDPVQVKANATWMSPYEIVQKLVNLRRSATVTFTGGDPVMWDLTELLRLMKEWSFMVNVETEGALYRDWLKECDFVTVSPKPPSSGMSDKLDHHVLDKYRALPGHKIMKIVIFDEGDLEFARHMHRSYPEYDFYLSVGTPVLPEADDVFVKNHIISRLNWLSDTVLKCNDLDGVSVLPQLHVLAWGTKLGV